MVNCPWPEDSPTYTAWVRMHNAYREYEDAVNECIRTLLAMPEGEAKVWARNSIASSIRSAIDVEKGGLTHLLKKLGPLCWLCGGFDPDITIEVECETPGGKPCKSKEVEVHNGCYMDMEP